MSRLLEEYGRKRFLEGYQEGFQEGLVQAAIEQGEMMGAIKIATRMLKRGTYTLEEIAEYVDLPLEKVEELARKRKEE